MSVKLQEDDKDSIHSDEETDLESFTTSLEEPKPELEEFSVFKKEVTGRWQSLTKMHNSR